jgi:hypothetical protein
VRAQPLVELTQLRKLGGETVNTRIKRRIRRVRAPNFARDCVVLEIGGSAGVSCQACATESLNRHATRNATAQGESARCKRKANRDTTGRAMRHVARVTAPDIVSVFGHELSLEGFLQSCAACGETRR